MRVVLNGRFLAQVRTGVQRYATETLLALDELLDDPARPSNLEFELAIPPDVAPLLVRNIRCVEVGKHTGHLWEQVDLWRHARGAYLVNFNYSGPLLKRRQLVTIHDAAVRAMPLGFSRAYRWTHTTIVAVLGRRAHTVMTVSAFSRDEIRRRFGLGRNDILIGVEGGEHVLAADADESILRKHGLEPGRYVLGVGSVKPNKNFDLIAQAMRLLPGFPWPVAIAGAKDIGIFRDAADLDASFVFLGYVSDEELSALYRHAACFVFPSSYEGFGLPVFEAMAHGCPVLSARASAMPEVCGDAVLYFDHDDPSSLADALLRFERDPTLRDILVAAGSRRMLDYNWRRNARILLDHLAAQAPRPPLPVKAASPLPPPLPTNSPARVGAVGTAASASACSGDIGDGVVPPMTGRSKTPSALDESRGHAPDAAAEPFERLAAARDGVLHVDASLAAGTLDFLEQATHELLGAGVPQTVLFSRCPETPADFERRFDSRVRFVELPSLRDGTWTYYRSLRKRLRHEVERGHYAAVHLHSSKTGFLGRLALAGTARPPLYYSPHGLSFLDRRFVLPGLAFTALERLAARVDATLVGCSEGEAQLLRRLGRREVRVVENAVPDSFFAIERRLLDPPVVMTLGRVCHQKGPELFAELAARFQLAEVPATFVWVGSGDAAGEAMLRGAGVKVTGWVSAEKVREHLAQARVYVQTSRWEGMPLSVLQALASGLPCVVTDVVGNREAVQQGITGYVARHPDALAMAVRRLLVDPALYARMSRAARTDAQDRFTGARLRQQLLRLYGLPEVQGWLAGEPIVAELDDDALSPLDVRPAVAAAGAAWRPPSPGTRAGAVP